MGRGLLVGLVLMADKFLGPLKIPLNKIVLMSVLNVQFAHFSWGG